MMLREAGVPYSHERTGKFLYRSEYWAIYEPTGERFSRVVYTESELGFYKLLDHWNRDFFADWRYLSKSS